jgi:hypothetical protein
MKPEAMEDRVLLSNKWKRTAAGLAACVAAGLGAACGGGGNESGPQESLTVSPSAVTVGSADSCAVGEGPVVHVYGGQPPYELANSVPNGMQLDKTRLQNSGEGFTITFINGVCMTNMPITIEDDMGRLGYVMVTNGG